MDAELVSISDQAEMDFVESISWELNFIWLFDIEQIEQIDIAVLPAFYIYLS